MKQKNIIVIVVVLLLAFAGYSLFKKEFGYGPYCTSSLSTAEDWCDSHAVSDGLGCKVYKGTNSTLAQLTRYCYGNSDSYPSGMPASQCSATCSGVRGIMTWTSTPVYTATPPSGCSSPTAGLNQYACIDGEINKCLSNSWSYQHSCSYYGAYNNNCIYERAATTASNAAEDCDETCDDNDGNDPNTASYVTVGTTDYDDYCNSATSVIEYTCSGDNQVSNSVACGTGKECVSGACVPVAVQDSCSDSDGGMNFLTAGTVTTVISGTTFTDPDYCQSSNELVEYYCSGVNEMIGGITCSDLGNYECQSGRCVAVVVPNTYQYKCDTNGLSLLQIINGNIQTTPLGNCNNGNTCNPGATTTTYSATQSLNTVTAALCTIAPHADSCTDTDGGDVSTTKGTVSGYKNNAAYSIPDVCSDDGDALYELYCSGNTWVEHDYTCTCANGACAATDCSGLKSTSLSLITAWANNPTTSTKTAALNAMQSWAYVCLI